MNHHHHHKKTTQRNSDPEDSSLLQQQQLLPPSRRRRLSHPIILPHHSSRHSRLQPLSVLPVVEEPNNNSSSCNINHHNHNDNNITTTIMMDESTATRQLQQQQQQHPPSGETSSSLLERSMISNNRSSDTTNSASTTIPPMNTTTALASHATTSATVTTTTTATTTTTSKQPPTPPLEEEKEELTRLYTYIVAMSESCRKHTLAIHSHWNENNVNNPSTTTTTTTESSLQFCIPLTNAPIQCQEAIQTLQRILPHIETTLFHKMMKLPLTDNDTTTTSTTKTFHSLVRNMSFHMCDFYMDVLQQQQQQQQHGTRTTTGFCPQAPHLLLHPQQILPRVHLLLNFLASQATATLWDEFTRENDDDDDDALTIPHQFIKVCHTIATLLNQIPYVSIIRHIVSDLIHQSKDLSIWYEMIHTNTAADMNMNQQRLDISILEETIHVVDWSKFNTDVVTENNNITNETATTTTTTIPEYIIHLPYSSESVRVMQWYTFVILEHLLTLNKQQRINPTHTTSTIVEELDPTNYCTCMGHDPDLFLTNHIDVDDMRTLLIPFRQIFESSSRSTSNVVSTCYLLNIASRILQQVQSDWHRSHVPNLSILQEAVLLIGYGVRYYLEVLPTIVNATHQSCMGGLIDISNDISENMTQLISNLIYHPPHVAGTMSRHDVTIRIHQLSYDIVLELVPLIQECRMIVVSQTSPSFPNRHDHTDSIFTVLLRTILAMQSTTSSSYSPLNGGLIQPLFLLMDDQILSDIVVFILSGILYDCNYGLSAIIELDNALNRSPAGSLQREPAVVIPDEVSMRSKRQLVDQPTNGRYSHKRSKTDRSRKFATEHDAMSILYNELHQYFDESLLDAISRLTAELQKTEVPFTDSFWSDLQQIASRFRLALLLVQNDDSETWITLSSVTPNLFRFVNDALSLISNITHRIVQSKDYHRDGPFNTNIVNVVELVVISGVFIEKSSWLKSSGLEIAHDTCRSILAMAFCWDILPSCYEGSKLNRSFQIKSTLHHVLIGYALYYRKEMPNALIQSTWIMNVQFMMISISINAQNLCDLSIYLNSSSSLKPISDDQNLQNQSVRLIAMVRSSHPAQIQLSSIDKIRTISNDVLLEAKWDHPNPMRRFMLWQTGAWLMRSMKVYDLHLWSRRRLENGNLIGTQLVNFLIYTAFLDSDATVLEYTSRELGNVLSCKKWSCVLALTSTDDEWQTIQNHVSYSTSNQSAESIMSRIFRFIEDILPIDQSTTEELENLVLLDERSADKSERVNRSAARTLSSFCIVKPYEVSALTNIAIRNSINLIVRLWSKMKQSTTRNIELDGYYFAELLRIAHCMDFGSKIISENLHTIAPALLRNLFAPFVSLSLDNKTDQERLRAAWKERQFSLLTAFIRAILAGRLGGIDHVSIHTETDIDNFVDAAFPSVIADFVVGKSCAGLQMLSGYKLFTLGQRCSMSKILKRMGLHLIQNDSISGFVLGDSSNNLAVKLWNRDLENHTRQLCLTPGVVEKIIPLIFMSSGDGLSFFINTVLQKKISLKQLVTSREMLTLKNFVFELGRNPELSEQIQIAMTKAAIVRSDNFDESSPESKLSYFVDGNGDAVMSWVTGKFMFLLVNVVQYKWPTKSTAQQVASLTSLLSILNFLQPAESSQYLPQIMATVNSVLSDKPTNMSPYEDVSQLKHLRLLAIQILSKFVKLMAHSQLEILGQNLTSVVVSLIPIFTTVDNEERRVLYEEERDGVALLEWLSSQQALQQYFEEIPFLPPTSSLDSVRARLKAQGVHFDHLLSVSTQATHDGTGTRSVASENGSIGGDSCGAASNALRQAALRRRLEMVSPLLENDSASVRGVALQHLTSLLRFNRELFHSLIENEGTTSLKRFVTVSYRDRNGKSRWNITDFIHTILSRCLKETDQGARILLATCFGEVGAISSNLLEETKTNDTHARKPFIPPWFTTPHSLGLQLVTTHLVAALKAAALSSDQHKIAFAIQQLLALLNDAGKSGMLSGIKNDDFSRALSTSTLEQMNKPKMDESLIQILVEADVIDVVEPFWFSEFHEAEAYDPKPFPFFRSSSSYYVWLSNLCRYMVHISYENRKTEWTMMFYACRTALRTKAGLGVADCLLPYLVLDCICFGSGEDRAMIISEMRDVLTFGNNGAALNDTMALTDRRNAVNAIFGVVDSLQMWIEPETDIKYSKRFQSPSKNHHPIAQVVSSVNCDWQRNESTMRIEDMMNELPLYLRGQAAFNVGMHANALRCLEMASRVTVVESVFGDESLSLSSHKHSRSRAAGSCPEEAVGLLKDVLASLNDYETIAALIDDNVWDTPTARTRDSIRQKEALHDWQGALHDYERAQQLSVGDPTMRIGIVKCLLELGHFDSVLQQVNCMRIMKNHNNSIDFSSAVPLAVEASWRLGRWDTLSELVETETVLFAAPDTLYQMHLGKALLCLQRKKHEGALLSLTSARSAVMDTLGNVARESYSRSYGHVVRLQAIREIEDVAKLLCSSDSSSIDKYVNDCNLGWNRRLELVSSLGAPSIMNTRLVLARLSSDTAYEGSLFLQMGKRARKSGMLGAAGNAFSQAEAALRCVNGSEKATLKCSLQLQFAKLKYDSGESSIALRMLGQGDIETTGNLNKDELVVKSCKRVLENLGIAKHGMDEKDLLNVFVRSALQSTRWMIDGGLKEGAEILARFKIIHCLAPTFEKGHFQFAKYVDSLLQSRILALQGRMPDHASGTTDEKLRNMIVSRDKACIRYIVLAIKHYAEALVLDVKHVYQALPRLLSLWFDFTSIPSKKSTMMRSFEKENSLDLDSLLVTNQDEINAFMASTYRKISAQTLYTAIPQLISRIIHDDIDTASVVQAILRRVLTKYPAQAMWPLSWIRQSRDPQRQQIGIDIFSQVTAALVKSESLHKLLVTSKTLIDYLYALAKKDVGEKVKDSMRVRPLSNEVDLCEFVPPIQAALSASLVSGDSSRSRDIFPRHIPRMRVIDEIVGVMSSKARPKKVRVFVVAAESIAQLRSGSRNSKLYDVGEIHFLLKQEVKGDLRKDARVQDLNNVINRIMSSIDKTANFGLGQNRRLHLRTFCVTCLSEETGLLEWVPHTASIRSMIAKTYNPQANLIHGKRQGKRITNFTDPQMRTKFENVCQATYFLSGDLTKAAALFERECLMAYPPVLYWWYVLQFPDPHAWYEARTRFALSTAAWSAVGHVIGLGDRHSENILLDKTSGECVHVDFDCIFDKGVHLPKPEVVPFRLTQNMVDALGPTGADGIYSWNLKAAMSVLRNNRDTLLSVLEPFVKDPVINWKRYRSQQRASYRAADRDPTTEAKQKMIVIDERLRGIYNLRNNNLKKILRIDATENQQDDELHHPIPLSVEGQVHKMIAEATSAENLVQLYVGWMPWV